MRGRPYRAARLLSTFPSGHARMVNVRAARLEIKLITYRHCFSFARVVSLPEESEMIQKFVNARRPSRFFELSMSLTLLEPEERG